jgi:hypothetical protein
MSSSRITATDLLASCLLPAKDSNLTSLKDSTSTEISAFQPSEDWPPSTYVRLERQPFCVNSFSVFEASGLFEADALSEAAAAAAAAAADIVVGALKREGEEGWQFQRVGYDSKGKISEQRHS